MPAISDYQRFIKQKKIGIAKESTTSGSMIAHGGGSEVRYYGPRYASDFIEGGLLKESDIPSQFHRALVAYVLMEYFEGKDPAQSAVWERVWRKKVREGRSLADDDYDAEPVQLRTHDF